jgi:DNA invertase Pin-like site-specific DNA recombinase
MTLILEGGRLVFHVFAALAEFERNLIRERTVAGLKAARARGRKGALQNSLPGRSKLSAPCLERRKSRLPRSQLASESRGPRSTGPSDRPADPRNAQAALPAA